MFFNIDTDGEERPYKPPQAKMRYFIRPDRKPPKWAFKARMIRYCQTMNDISRMIRLIRRLQTLYQIQRWEHEARRALRNYDYQRAEFAIGRADTLNQYI